jgi:hypothetical protein
MNYLHIICTDSSYFSGGGGEWWCMCEEKMSWEGKRVDKNLASLTQ